MGVAIGNCDIGGASLDVLIPSDMLTVGETVEVETRVSGHTGTQQIEVEDVELTIEALYRTEDGFEKTTIVSYELIDGFSIGASLTKTRRTEITLPYQVPCILGSVDVVAAIEFNIRQTTVKHEGYLDVKPTDSLQSVLYAMFDLGFALRNVECQRTECDNSDGVIQRLDFQPRDGPFRGSFEEVKLFVRERPEEVALFAVVDSEAKGLCPIPQKEGASIAVRRSRNGQIRSRLRPFIQQNIPDR